MARSTVAVRFTGNANDLQGTIGKVEGRLGGLGRVAKTAGKVVAVGLGAGIVGGVALGKQVLDLGGKLTSWRQKSATVFEGNASDIKRWADKNNEIFGLTDDELVGLAASFGDLLKPMGFTADQAASMSKDVVGLSGALSEWSGGQRSAAEVSTILSKAMLGEREGLKELGISISEADVQARLAAKGQDKLTGAALDQAKAVATQELIFEKSTDAQKAYAEGGNKALRSSNKLKAGFGELKERIAGGLLPIVVGLADTFGDKVMPVLDEVAGGIAAFAGAFKAADGDITSSGFPGFMERLAFQARTAFDQISAKVREWWPIVVGAIRQVVDFVAQHWPEIQRIIGQVITTVVTVVSGAVSVITTLWNNFGNNILSFVQRVWPAVQQVIQGALNIIQGIVKTVTALIRGDWSQVWEGIKQIVSGAWSAIQGIVRAALEAVRGVVGIGLEVVGSVIKGAWNGIVDFFRGIPGRLRSAAGDMFGFVLSSFKSAINSVIGLWNGLKFPSIKIGGGDPLGPFGPSLPEVTIGGWKLPNIPYLAKGGTATAGRLHIVGEHGPEPFVPGVTGTVLANRHLRDAVAAAAAPKPDERGRSVQIQELHIHSSDPPRRWLDEGLWRMAL